MGIFAVALYQVFDRTEASMAASREFIHSVSPEEIDDSIGNVRITMDHFEQALDEVTASVTDDVRERYREIEKRFASEDLDAGPETEASRTFH